MPRSDAVDLDELGAALTAWVQQQLQEDEEILRRQVAGEIAHRTLAHVVQESARVAFDRGQYAQGWDVHEDEHGFEITNSAPYAGVIELGRRPMRPGPPLEPILAWVKRQGLASDEDEAERMAWAIREKIHREGTAPKRILGDTVDEQWDAWLREAVDLHLDRRRRT